MIGLNNNTYTSSIYYCKGEYNPNDIIQKDQLLRAASNPQIHDITILTKAEFEKQSGFKKVIHPVILPDSPNYFMIDLGSMVDEELFRTGKKGTLNLDLVKPNMTQEQIDNLRGGTLSIAPDYMKLIQKYTLSDKNARAKGLMTDTELEVIAQMWSEHCRHSLYNAKFPGSEKGIFYDYIKKPTMEILKRKPHLGVSVFSDNSGVIEFNKDYYLCIKNETHNSPSALDPYGGAITGIVGVNRDPFGTGIGTDVILNFLFFYFGHKDDKRRNFKSKNKDGTLEGLLLNPGQIESGVIQGVKDGANKTGIGLLQGSVVYHDNYNGKPIVGVGCIGFAPKIAAGKKTFEKHIDVNDRLYIIGGRAGKDGIHGATFSSEALTASSPATAVQIGDPYTQRKVGEAIIELRDKGYIKFITDLGAGGVSCAAFEMASETNGIEIDLDKLLVKYPGLTATEILMNESQERMAIAVDEKNKSDIEAILNKHGVEFSDIGVFTDSGRAVAYYKKDKVVDLDMEFMHNCPQRELHPENYKLGEAETSSLLEKYVSVRNGFLDEGTSTENDKFGKEFDAMIRRPNLGSIESITDVMDSSVKGNAVQHCIQGKGRVTTKSSAFTPLITSNEGMIMSYGFCERQSYIDSQRMGKNAFLRSIGNNIAMGGNLDYMAATDQALWQSSDDGKYQQMLIEANKGMSDVIKGCDIPVISGKDSMYNQAKVYDEKGKEVKRGVFPTLLMISLGKMDDISKMVTADAKDTGDLVYVVGSKTKSDLGGSEFMNLYSELSGNEFNVGKVSDENISDVYDTFRKMNAAVNNGFLKSSKYIEAGGLAIALRDTAMAGEKGVIFDVDRVHKDTTCGIDDVLYSETEGRFLVTISKDKKEKFENLFNGKYSRIGEITDSNFVAKNNGRSLFARNISGMLSVYHEGA